MLGYDLDWWNQAMLISLSFAALAAVTVVISTAAVVRLQKQESLDAAQQIARAHIRIAELEVESANARAAIAGAEERAKGAEQRAAEANLELARLKAPRTLSVAQRERIISKIKEYENVQFDMAVAQGDPEASDFLLILEVTLADAGWEQIPWKGGDIVFSREGKPTVGLITERNIAIGVYPEIIPILGGAVAALTSALSAEGISARAGPIGPDFMNTNKQIVHIMIGRKT